MCPIIDLGFMHLSTFYIFVSLGLIVSIVYFIKTFDGNHEEYHHCVRSFLLCLIFAAVGSKLFYVFIVFLKQGVIDFNGSVFYGGILSGGLGLFLYVRHYQLSFYRYSDMFLRVVPLGHAIARIGCYFNGCCYGRIAETLISVNYPINGIMVKVIPTWFIESIFCLFLFFVLSRYKGKSGDISLLYFLLYGIYRFFIEFFRGDIIRGVWLCLSTSQILSLLVMICIFLLVRGGRQYDHK